MLRKSERSEASVAARGGGFQENGHASSVGNIVAAKLVALESEDKIVDVTYKETYFCTNAKAS